MTNEEKARAYDEALKDMRVIYPNLRGDAKLAVEHAFPQLVESEDERIRKLLVWQVHRNIEDETNDLTRSVYDGIKGHHPDLEESIEDWKKCLAWLERQKENTWSEEDDAKVKAMCKEGDLKPTERAWLKNLRNRVWKEPQHAIRVTKGFGDPDGPQFELVDLQEEQKPGEEDKKLIDEVITLIEDGALNREEKDFYIGRLKSLRPQPHWMPSKEQMDALERCIDYLDESDNDDFRIMLTLYEQLVSLEASKLEPF